MDEQRDSMKQPPSEMNDARSFVPRADPQRRSILPQLDYEIQRSPSIPDQSSNGAGAMPYVYAIGAVEARFPNLAAEKEFAQAAGRADTNGKTDRQVFHDVLSRRENRYLVRQLCWVLTIQGLETYLLQPVDPIDTDLLADAIRPAHAPVDIDVVIGVRGPIASPDMCNSGAVCARFFTDRRRGSHSLVERRPEYG